MYRIRKVIRGGGVSGVTSIRARLLVRYLLHSPVSITHCNAIGPPTGHLL
jgi:hypothetical protein